MNMVHADTLTLQIAHQHALKIRNTYFKTHSIKYFKHKFKSDATQYTLLICMRRIMHLKSLRYYFKTLLCNIEDKIADQFFMKFIPKQRELSLLN